ncbi:MAG: apolipoprotein N-acyltransferase [Myxococcales bacterium]|nr:apolipoprotein N-acyltransferase [Myxococcales bacterium]
MPARIQAVVLAALAGVSFLGYSPPWEPYTLAFFAFPLWLAAIERTRGGPWVGFLVGGLVGFVANIFALHSTVALIAEFGSFPWAVAVFASSLLWAWQAMPYALAGATACALASGPPRAWPRRFDASILRAAFLPVAFVVTSSWVPTLFPWRVGAGPAKCALWAQLAEVGGIPVLDLALGLGPSLICAGLARAHRRTLIAGALAALLPIGYGAVRLPMERAERAAAPPLRVGVVQPNISVPEKRDPARRPHRLQELRRLTAEAEAAGAELVVWPETSYPYHLSRRRVREPRDAKHIHGEGVTGPLIIGVVTEGKDGHGHNSAVAIDADGRFRGIADKVHLLAFGEFVPFWDWLPPLQRRYARGLYPGDGPQTLDIAGARIGIVNCYEDLLWEFVRSVARRDPALLVNVTNDAWFGHSNEPMLHQSMARVRAIETRRDLVRAVNTGVSSHTLSTGEDAIRTESWQQTWFVSEVRLGRGQTFWVRFGDVVTPSLAALLLAAVFWRRRCSGSP